MSDDFIHKEYPKQFARDEFWLQIKRTVNGRQVSENDIEMIVERICRQLILNSTEHLLDLGCGNAALSSRMFNLLGKYTGVDFSEYLLSVANEYFKPNENITYHKSDIYDFILNEKNPSLYNKILCYGVISYLPSDKVICLLGDIRDRFQNVERIYLGNIPNRKKAEEFYSKRDVGEYNLDAHDSSIGFWWDPDDMAEQVLAIGFDPEISYMPSSFYASEYRFDLTLKL